MTGGVDESVEVSSSSSNASEPEPLAGPSRGGAVGGERKWITLMMKQNDDLRYIIHHF